MIKSVTAKNYVTESGMMISGTFKSTNSSDSLEFVKDNEDSITKWQMAGEHAGDKFKITVSNKADVLVGGDIPDAMLDVVTALLLQYNRIDVVGDFDGEEPEEAELDGQDETKAVLPLVPPLPPMPPAPTLVPA
jgi:hypothetical protein